MASSTLEDPPKMDEEEQETSTIDLTSTSDICKALMDRYAKSRAPQHRHLIATAAAMRSILLDECLPLTPPAYFAAAISSLQGSDPDSVPAISSLLSIILSMDSMEIPPVKSGDAVVVVSDFLKLNTNLGTGTVRSLVKSLGLLALRVDLEDWTALKPPLQTLLVYAVDKRPKVRKCSQECVEKVFKALHSSGVIKNASKAVFSIYKKYIPVFEEISSDNSKHEDLEVLHMLNVLTAVVPNLSKKVRMKIMSGVCERFGCSFWSCTRHILRLLEALVECLRAEDFVHQSDNMFSALTSYISTENNPIDTVISASVILKNGLKELHDVQPSLWIKFLPPICASLVGYLNSEANTSKHAEVILKELIDGHINQKLLLATTSAPCNYAKDTPETTAISSVCVVFDQVLDACDNPSETMLAVISALFLALGEFAYFLMKNIFLKLSQKMKVLKAESPIKKHSRCIERFMFGDLRDLSSVECRTMPSFLSLRDLSSVEWKPMPSFLRPLRATKHEQIAPIIGVDVMQIANPKNLTILMLEACIGTAVIAMGPEKVLSLLPIYLDGNNGTCSNTVMLSILKKYVMGASLQYFMEHIVPLAKSVWNAREKVKKQSRLKDLQTCFYGLWELLPAFCRYPIDTSESFEALSKLLIASLEDNPSLHETIAKAVQELVNGTRSVIKNSQCANPRSSVILNDCNMEARCLLFCYSKKTASRNMKALACSTMNLFQVFIDIFLVSPPEKRTSLKEAIGCLAFVLGSEKIKYFFVSLMEKCESGHALIESRKLEAKIQKDDMMGETEKTVDKGSKNMRYKKLNFYAARTCLMLELASAFVEVAEEDLANIIFSYIKSYLVDSDGTCQSEAYYTLNRILEAHSWFCLVRIDDLMDLLFSVNIPVDSETMKNRFSCFHYLLVHILKKNDEDMNTKAFLILNEIIVTLKTKKESRKLAYNVLLNISSTLKDSKATDGESDLERLLNMVMGYLSSSSPHIMSGAISALSLLIYNDASFCIGVRNLIPSVLTSLQNQSIEVIKAALGFVKVLVSSLHSRDLIKFLADILDAMLPWSSVSKHHFRSKVGIILEILIRKCGIDAVGLFVPDKYKGFVKSIDEGRQKNKIPGGVSSSETVLENRGQKRRLEDPLKKHLTASSDSFRKGKRRRQQEQNFGANKKTSVEAGRNQLTNRGMNNKRKNVDEKANKRNKLVKSVRKKDASNKNIVRASLASKSNASTKSSKHKRF